MFAKRVLDSQGREWTIEKRWTLWHRIVRPVDLVTGSYPHRDLLWAETQPASPSPAGRSGLGWQVAAVALTPLLVVEIIGTLLFMLFMFPFAVLELALLGITGFCIGLARATGLARHRVDVTCWTGRKLHSETALLVRGHRRAQQLVEELAADRFAAQRPFRPRKLPTGVTVRSHRSIWQPPDKWVPSVGNSYGSTNDHIRRTQLVTLAVGTCVVLLVAWLLANMRG